MDTKKALSSWSALNEALRDQCKTEKDAQKLIEAEQAGLNRATFLARIFSRFAKLRTARERREIMRGGR
jgi:hypothetical protein